MSKIILNPNDYMLIGSTYFLISDVEKSLQVRCSHYSTEEAEFEQ